MISIFNRLTILFIGLAYMLGVCKASTPVDADSAYLRGDYPTAIDEYKEIARIDGVSSSLLYNLGNAYAKAGDNGHALLCYIRSLRLDPSNSQAEANLKYVESKVKEANKSEIKNRKVSLDPDSESFISSVRKFISRNHLSDTWALWAVVGFLLFIGCLAIYIFTRNVIARKIGFFCGGICLIVTIIALIFAFMAASYRTQEGIIITNKVKLRSEPSVSAKENATALTRGTRLTILDSIPKGKPNPQWYKVRLNSDFIGWVVATDFESVNM